MKVSIICGNGVPIREDIFVNNEAGAKEMAQKYNSTSRMVRFTVFSFDIRLTEEDLRNEAIKK